MSQPISAIVITLNEEELLPRCLSALTWADEVLVVDSFSQDLTVELARSAGARVIQHAFQDYARQRNFAQAQAQHDWVLFIDADEVVSPTLRDNLVALRNEEALGRYSGYWLARVELFSGRWWPDPAGSVLPGGQRVKPFTSPMGTVRLFDRRLGDWTRALHEVAQIPQPTAIVSGPLYHYSQSNLSRALEPLDASTSLEAAYLESVRGGRRAGVAEALLRAARHAAYVYYRYRWWKLGEHGVALAVMAAYTKFMCYAKLWERGRIRSHEGEWLPRDRQLLEKYPATTGDQ